jgi:hypothetical protein
MGRERVFEKLTTTKKAYLKRGGLRHGGKELVFYMGQHPKYEIQ